MEAVQEGQPEVGGSGAGGNHRQSGGPQGPDVVEGLEPVGAGAAGEPSQAAEG